MAKILSVNLNTQIIKIIEEHGEIAGMPLRLLVYTTSLLITFS